MGKGLLARITVLLESKKKIGGDSAFSEIGFNLNKILYIVLYLRLFLINVSYSYAIVNSPKAH